MSSETTTERFNRVAEPRTNAILEKLRLLGQCSNRNNYSYTDEKIRQIFRAIDTELRKTKALFNRRTSKDGKFKLKM